MGEEEKERFWANVDRSGSCWLWTGPISSTGYGGVQWQGRRANAHKVAYVMERGPVPKGLQLDHLCRVRRCVNPIHLEPVTNAVNTRRGARAKLSEALAAQIRETYLAGLDNRAELGRRFKIDPSIVSRVLSGETWGGPDIRLPGGPKHGVPKLKPGQASQIRRMVSAGMSRRKLAQMFGVSPATINRIASGEAYRMAP